MIGCGAIAERYMLVLKPRMATLSVAVDLDGDTASEFARVHGFTRWATDYQDICDDVDAVILCVPNYLHAPVTVAFLERGISVLCEKPMATSLAEARKMADAADRSDGVLAIANVRRHYWSSQEVARILSDGSMGDWISIEAEEGSIFGWPTKSGFFFDKRSSGGGVLIDMGSHLLDLILWWTGDYPSSISCRDDNFGGVEADCEMEFLFPGDKRVAVKHSRLRNLDNRYDISLDGGTITVRPYEFNSLTITEPSGAVRVVRAPKNRSIEGYFQVMVADYLAAVTGVRPLSFSPEEILPSIRLIEECYDKATRLGLPWL